MTNRTTDVLNEAADSVERNVRCQTHTEANGKANAVEHLRQLAAEAQPDTRNPSVITDRVLSEVLAERIRQDDRWGEQNHPDGTGVTPEQIKLAENAKAMCQQAFAEGRGDWAHVLFEEVREALAESGLPQLRAELVQIAAVAVAWIEAIDRRSAVVAPDAASVPPGAPVRPSQPSSASESAQSPTGTPEGALRASAAPEPPNPYANGMCTYGEDQAPGSGCIKPAGHNGAHYVTPGDTDDHDL